MKKAFRDGLKASFFLVVFFPGLADAQSIGRSEAVPKITVRVYDYAQVPDGTRTEANSIAGKVLAKAGVPTEWIDCAMPEAKHNPVCVPPRDSRVDLVVRILAGSKEARAGIHPSCCGYAQRAEDGSGGTYATLFFDCVEKTAKELGMHRDVVLGHLVAHELGHLLLPEGAHSKRGIMRGQLNREDWLAAAQGTLLFTTQQAEQLRAETLARTVAVQITARVHPE